MAKARKRTLRPFTHGQKERIWTFLNASNALRAQASVLADLRKTVVQFLTDEQIEELDTGLDWVAEGAEFLAKNRETIRALVQP